MKRTRIYVFGVVLFVGSGLLFVANWADAAKSDRISFASNSEGNFDIYVMDTNGENLRLLTNHPADEKDLTWSPDGRFFAYTSNRDGDFKIYIMDTRTGEHRRFTNRDEREWTPAWSPDGKWIAFVSDGDEEVLLGEWGKFKITSNIYKADINGAHLVQLTDKGTNVGPAWSPDSQQIAFVSYHRGDERKGIYVMNADGRRLRRIDDKQVQVLDGIIQGECAWSPDGKQIAFSMVVPREDHMHLYVMDVDGKNFRQLTQGTPILGNKDGTRFPEIRQPAWSPNGKWIAYVYENAPGNADIYVIDAMGNGRG
ncbi:MAG: DPP IV N-terminal domain-containing protein, partial [Candidatus Poribacteria bacterium]|nr:DPP IV N-terminal domain-containing protein [Candidatus Poribacteria bacterium]